MGQLQNNALKKVLRDCRVCVARLCGAVKLYLCLWDWELDPGCLSEKDPLNLFFWRTVTKICMSRTCWTIDRYSNLIFSDRLMLVNNMDDNGLTWGSIDAFVCVWKQSVAAWINYDSYFWCFEKLLKNLSKNNFVLFLILISRLILSLLFILEQLYNVLNWCYDKNVLSIIRIGFIAK